MLLFTSAIHVVFKVPSATKTSFNLGVGLPKNIHSHYILLENTLSVVGLF
jgi:hypothetical protein